MVSSSAIALANGTADWCRVGATRVRARSIDGDPQMITGYNTDVRYGNLVLHVQTEDKGQSNPCIESLVYHGGQVVVAKRASYADLLADGGTDDAITSFMDRQHRALIESIQRGQFDEEIQGSQTDSQPIREPITGTLELANDTSRSLDQVILEYLAAEAQQEQLVLEIENDVDLRPGDRVRLNLRAQSSKSGQPIAGAKVNARIISTQAGPRTLAVGETDTDGAIELVFEVPSVQRGSAALIINGTSDIGQAQIKHVL